MGVLYENIEVEISVCIVTILRTPKSSYYIYLDNIIMATITAGWHFNCNIVKYNQRVAQHRPCYHNLGAAGQRH